MTLADLVMQYINPNSFLFRFTVIMVILTVGGAMAFWTAMQKDGAKPGETVQEIIEKIFS